MLTCNMVWSLTLKPLLIPQHQLHVGPPAPYLTLRTDLQRESQTCGSQSWRPPESTYSHCLTTMPSSGFQHSLGGQSPSRKSGVITLFDPNDTSLPWSITFMTHTLPFPQSRTHTQTWTENVWPHLIYCPGHYSHGSRCGQHHFRFNQTNHPFSGTQTLWKHLWDVLNAGLPLTEKPTWRVCFSPASEKCRVTNENAAEIYIII